MLFGVKAAHSLIFLVLQSMIVYLVYTGLRGRTDRKTAVVAGVIGVECAIYAGNGFRCPLTGLAEDLGAERGSVTDIFLPQWLAANVARIYGPMFALALWLHYRNLRRLQRARLLTNLSGEAFERGHGAAEEAGGVGDAAHA
jgi:hypothetical protein